MIYTIWTKGSLLLRTDNNKENIYCDESSNIFNSLNTSLQDSLYPHVVWTWVTRLYAVMWFELICVIFCLCFCIIIQNGQKGHNTIIYTIVTCSTPSCPVTGVWIYKVFVCACMWGGVSPPLFSVSMLGIFPGQQGAGHPNTETYGSLPYQFWMLFFYWPSTIIYLLLAVHCETQG